MKFRAAILHICLILLAWVLAAPAFAGPSAMRDQSMLGQLECPQMQGEHDHSLPTPVHCCQEVCIGCLPLPNPGGALPSFTQLIPEPAKHAIPESSPSERLDRPPKHS